jgi:DNA-binding NtrC family response regulator
VITENELQLHVRKLPNSGPGYKEIKTLEELERGHIEAALDLENGRVGLAALRLGVPRSSLYEKLKHYGISRKETVARQYAEK